MIRRLPPLLAALAAAGTLVAGCGGGSTGAFRPDPPASVPPPPPAPPSAADYGLPGGITLEFTSPLPGDPTEAKIVVAYQDFQNAFHAAIHTGGRDRRYLDLVAPDAAPLLGRLRAEVGRHRAAGTELTGRLRFFNTRVTRIFAGRGAALESCVDTSEFFVTDAGTHERVRPVDRSPSRARHATYGVLRLGGDGRWRLTGRGDYYAPNARVKECGP